MVHIKAVKTCLIAVAITLVAVATAIMPSLTASVLTLSPQLVAKLITVGGTGNPTGGNIETLVGGSLVEGRTVQAIHTPQQFWPVNGPLTLHESVLEGTDNVVAWGVSETDPDLHLVTVSQGSVVVSLAIARWKSDPANAPPPSVLKIDLLANPMRPNGGVLARFPGLSIPGIGITFYGPTPESDYKVTDSAFAYDLYANAPLYGNPLSWFNAFAGIAFPYNGGNSLHGTDPDYTNPDLDVRTEVYGNTTYHTIIPKNLPMLEPLRMAGLGGLADVIQPLLKVWVDAGYYKSDPAASPGVHMPAQLFMPIENVIRALAQSPGAILEGLTTIPRNLGIVQDQSPQPSQTEEPPAVDNGDTSGTDEIGDNSLMMSTTSNTEFESSNNQEESEVTTDPPTSNTPVDTGGQGAGGLLEPSEPLVSNGGGNGEQGSSLRQSQKIPNTNLPKEGSEDDEATESPKEELKEDDDDDKSLRTSLGSIKDDEKNGKKDNKEGEESPGSKLSKVDNTPPSKRDAKPNGDSPSGASPAGNESNDKANAA